MSIKLFYLKLVFYGRTFNGKQKVPVPKNIQIPKYPETFTIRFFKTAENNTRNRIQRHVPYKPQVQTKCIVWAHQSPSDDAVN